MLLFYENFLKKLVTISLVTSMAITTACQKTSPIADNNSSISNSSTSETAITKISASSVSATSSTNQTVTSSGAMTIYSTFDSATLAPLLQSYTASTGTQVHVITDTADHLLDRLKNEAENTPADMLLVQDVGTFWQAKDLGIIQPFNSEKVFANVPDRMRDDKGEWVGVSYYARTAVYDSRVGTANDISSYANFAKPVWAGKLCLSSGNQVANQSLLVNILNNLGEAKTIEVIKGWLANSVAPVLTDDTAVLKAIETGKCQVGLVNSDVYGRLLEQNTNTPVKLTWVNKGYGGTSININGVAITKNGKHPEYALNFIEWLTQKDQQGLFASVTHSYPINYPTPKSAEASVMLKSWGDFEPSAMPLVKYGEMRKDSLELMKTAGYQ